MADAKVSGGDVDTSLHAGIVQRINAVLLVFSLISNFRHPIIKSKKAKDATAKNERETVLKVLIKTLQEKGLYAPKYLLTDVSSHLQSQVPVCASEKPWVSEPAAEPAAAEPAGLSSGGGGGAH